MKKILIPIICILSILFVLINIDDITNNLVALIHGYKTMEIEDYNNYYKNDDYIFVQNTKDFTPYGKQDLLNIIYTTINSGSQSFTFYCPKEYSNCLKDINDISNDKILITHLNNFVHPFNSMTKLLTTISDFGEVTLEVKYLYNKEEIKMVDDEVGKIIKQIIKDDDTDYDKIKTVHDYIINKTKYDVDMNQEIKSFNAYGALFNNMATCNGYTDLMAIFLSKMGYDNFRIATTGAEINDEKATGHVWNAVYVDNEWVHLDLTWDDPVSTDGKNYLYHKYFLIDSDELKTADSNITSNEHNFNKAIYTELKKED